MTAPAPSLPPACLLYVDGVRYQDGTDDAGDPVALDGLVITWGRDTIVDQPSPASASFTVSDLAGGQSFRPALYVGARVGILASARIYGAPVLPSFDDPSFEVAPFGGTVGGGTAVVVATPDAHTGARALRIEPSEASQTVTVTIPPRPFSTDPIAWDDVPRGQAGQTWTLTAWVKISPAIAVPPYTTAYVQAVAFTHPDGRAPTLVGSRVAVTAAAGWQQVTIPDLVLPVDAWVGVRVTTVPAGPAWDDIPPTVRWDDLAATMAWDDLGIALVDDVDVLAPPEGAVRQGAVFSGRITDLDASYDLLTGGTLVKVIAQDDLAELSNRYVGDAPWAAVNVITRVNQIIAAANQPNLSADVDPGVAGRILSYLDVDASPAAGLLQRVTQSVGGALWVTTSVAPAPAVSRLRVEDIDARPALLRLVNNGGVIVIIPVVDVVDGIELDACDVLLDPVHWVQDSTDTATQVAVGWRDPGVENPPQPIARTETATNDYLALTRGRFRVGVQTELTTQADAAALAGTWLARLSSGGWRITGLTWDLAATDLLDGPALDRVMTVLDGTTRPGLPILLTGLPTWSPVAPGLDRVPLYLEGGRFANTRGAWSLSLATSSAFSQGKADVTWDAMDPTWSWDMFSPDVSWDDLAGVGLT